MCASVDKGYIYGCPPSSCNSPCVPAPVQHGTLYVEPVKKPDNNIVWIIIAVIVFILFVFLF